MHFFSVKSYLRLISSVFAKHYPSENCCQVDNDLQTKNTPFMLLLENDHDLSHWVSPRELEQNSESSASNIQRHVLSSHPSTPRHINIVHNKLRKI